ncbi:hypothetical protein CsatA_024171 [Cannabis sativa]
MNREECSTIARFEIFQERGKKNFFIIKFLCLVKYFEDIIIVDKKGKKKVQHDVFYDENDDVFLDSIFDMIMLFVFFLFCPFFSFKLEIDDIIELGDFLVQMFEAKLWELIPLLIEDHPKFLNHSIQRDIEMKELIVQILDSKISELWC